MAHSLAVEVKLTNAHRVMQACMGEKGLWASPYRYKDQCWTRDFVYAGQRYLIRSGRADLARMHLLNMMSGQKIDGRVPIMYLDRRARWLAGKAWNSIRNRRLSFLLRAYFSRDGVGWLSPWTRDSEMLLLLGLGEYQLLTGDNPFVTGQKDHTVNALLYLTRDLKNGQGLIRGADWRDTRPDLDTAYLLSNNVLMHRALRLLFPTESVKPMAGVINAEFWNGQYFRDYVGSDEPRTSPDEFDTFGNALAILYGIASPEQAASILDKVQELDTDFGYRLNTVTLPPKNEAEADLMSRISQTGVIWPFVHAYMLLAALHAGRRDLAEEGFHKWTRLSGFWEYYDPEQGTGHGSEDQMWSAAMYIRVAEELGIG